MLKGTESLGEGFKGIFQDMADYAIQQLTRIAMNNLLFGNSAGTPVAGGFGILNWIGSLIPKAEGGIMNASFYPFHAYAGGGIADRPTFGVFGEGGPEAFVPLRNGKIPVEGSKGQTVVYNDNRVTNYIDALDQKSIEDRVTGPVVRGMGRPKYREAMKNIVRRNN
jgi:phage-related minor tail protein